MLTAGQLAQFRGCEPWNHCYWECVDSAQWTIDDPDGEASMTFPDREDELRQAEEWAATVKWVP